MFKKEEVNKMSANDGEMSIWFIQSGYKNSTIVVMEDPFDVSVSFIEKSMTELMEEHKKKEVERRNELLDAITST